MNDPRADGAAPLRFVPGDPESVPVTAALARYAEELVEMGIIHPENVGQITLEPAEFSPPRGVVLLGTEGSVVRAMGGIRRLNGEVAEVKRMWVDRGLRGQGNRPETAGGVGARGPIDGCHEVGSGHGIPATRGDYVVPL